MPHFILNSFKNDIPQPSPQFPFSTMVNYLNEKRWIDERLSGDSQVPARDDSHYRDQRVLLKVDRGEASTCLFTLDAVS